MKAGGQARRASRFPIAVSNEGGRQELDKLMNRALNNVGDVFDQVNTTDTEEAAKTAPRSNSSWAQVEATLKIYGVDTGEPSSLGAPK